MALGLRVSEHTDRRKEISAGATRKTSLQPDACWPCRRRKPGCRRRWSGRAGRTGWAAEERRQEEARQAAEEERLRQRAGVMRRLPTPATRTTPRIPVSASSGGNTATAHRRNSRHSRDSMSSLNRHRQSGPPTQGRDAAAGLGCCLGCWNFGGGGSYHHAEEAKRLRRCCC